MRGEPGPGDTQALRSSPARPGSAGTRPRVLRAPEPASPAQCPGLAPGAGAHPKPRPTRVLPAGGLRLGKGVLQGGGGARRAAEAAVRGAPVPAAEEAQPAARVREQRYSLGVLVIKFRCLFFY